jgi:hypothetical protein
MSAGEKTAGQVAYEAHSIEITRCSTRAAFERVAAAVIAHVRPQIEEEYRKRYPTGFCDCACKMDEAGDNVLSLCNTHRDYVKAREAEARAAAIEDAKTAIRALSKSTTDDASPPYRSRHTTLADAAEYISDLASAPPGHVCVPVNAMISAKPLLFEERSGEWFDASFGFHIALDATGTELFYTASLGEGDPADFPTLSEAKEWCQNEADRFMQLNAMLSARPK